MERLTLAMMRNREELLVVIAAHTHKVYRSACRSPQHEYRQACSKCKRK